MALFSLGKTVLKNNLLRINGIKSFQKSFDLFLFLFHYGGIYIITKNDQFEDILLACFLPKRPFKEVELTSTGIIICKKFKENALKTVSKEYRKCCDKKKK